VVFVGKRRCNRSTAKHAFQLQLLIRRFFNWLGRSAGGKKRLS
jgi:hypothetical protein